MNKGISICSFLQGFHVLIQSEREPDFLDSRVENFLQGAEVRLTDKKQSGTLFLGLSWSLLFNVPNKNK